MPRAHCYRPVLDPQGNVLSDLVVRVYEPGTTTLISEPIYLGLLDPTGTDQPIPFTNGVINFYLDDPKRVRIGVRKGVNPEQYFEDIDVVGAGTLLAENIEFTPSGDLTATDVQTALEEIYDNAFTQEDADLLYAPIPQSIEETDQETGAPTTVIAKFSLQHVVEGVLAESPNLIKPGLRIPQPGHIVAIIARVDEAPAGDDIVIAVERWNGGAFTSSVGNVTIPMGQTLGVHVFSGFFTEWAKGDVAKFPCLQVGTTTPGADLNISLDFM